MNLSSKTKNVSRVCRAFVAVALFCLVVSVPGLAQSGRAIKTRVAPVYPEIAKRMHISGAVRVSVTIDAEGKVTDAKPVSGNQMLAAAAVDAVRKWRFEPGTGETTVELDINFVAPQ
ncbi:MAG TPA: energy transducer TonB [Terracidiphilus sp.]